MKPVDKKTKIVATIGPASSKKEVLQAMIEKGVNVCRLNFSHGEHEEYKKIIELIRELNVELKTHTAILADLQGPKIRIGKIADEPLLLNTGDILTFTNNPNADGSNNTVYMNYADFPKDVKSGELILLDDGKLQLEITETNKKDTVKAKVIYGGELKSNKGVNLPNTKISLPCLTEKDLRDLDFVLSQQVDWIGLSFVRNANDIHELQAILEKNGSDSRIVAKIEKPEALDDIDNIIKATDAIMVARGDLGVEIPMEEVPLVQKELVKKSIKYAKPVIIATQMMETMITNFRPTRAEVNDVANAVMDGADAVMLSAETSVGKYPVEVIEVMTKIVQDVERYEGIYHHEYPPELNEERFITDSICYNACRLAQRTQTSAIVTMTHSGYTGFKISSFRPKAGVYVFTGNYKILSMLSLVWGVKAFYYDKFVSTDHTIADIKYILKKHGCVKNGDLIINIASMPISEKGQSNMLKLSYID